MKPSYFFCTECGAIHEVWWNDLHNKKWADIMLYIAETNPKSGDLADQFSFTRRMAQRYLKEYKEMTSNLVRSRLSKGLRTEEK